MSKVQVRMIYQFLNEQERNYVCDKLISNLDDNISLLTDGATPTQFYGMVQPTENGIVCVLHREDGPALLSIQGYAFFFIAGRQVSIEDLPCDDICKMVLRIKYGDSDETRSFHPMYSISKTEFEFT